MKKLLIIIISIAVIAFLIGQYLASPRSFNAAQYSAWQPISKNVASVQSSITPNNNAFYALHGDTHNSDEVSVAVAHSVAEAWTVEKHLFTAEGPTEDAKGNVYFSPLYPSENVVLVSLDGKTGKRRWAIPADSSLKSAGGGAPLILNDPDNSGQQIIYIGLYHRIIAVRQNGDIVWDMPTGLVEPLLALGDLDTRHVFGLNYHLQADALVGLTSAGDVFVIDRATGKQLLAAPRNIEGAPGVSSTGGPSESITAKVDALMAQVFGVTDNGMGRFGSILQALFGGGFKVSNYFAIDKNTGRIFIAATSPDEIDGLTDGLSSYGSLYGFDLTKADDDSYSLRTVARRDFTGGTGASPALKPDGSRVYTADNDHNVLAFDRDLNPIWSIELPANIPASISVSSENNELYAISMFSIYKLQDLGDKAVLVWTADLDVFPELGPYQNFNICTATIAANGIAVSVGSGLTDGEFTLPLNYGVGLLDRETGELVSYNPIFEESVSVTAVSSDGGYYLANSPVRRSVAATLFGSLVRPLSGGISRYAPTDKAMLVKQTKCAASKRLSAADQAINQQSKSAFIAQANSLATQGDFALAGLNASCEN